MWELSTKTVEVKYTKTYFKLKGLILAKNSMRHKIPLTLFCRRNMSWVLIRHSIWRHDRSCVFFKYIIGMVFRHSVAYNKIGIVFSFIYTHMYSLSLSTLKRNAYNEIYLGNSMNVCICLMTAWIMRLVRLALEMYLQTI